MYDNATKETWRGWVWNRVADRVPKGSTVICLCGDSSGDVGMADRRGLNCVGVDIDAGKVRRFRKSGGMAVHGDLFEVARELQPAAIIADMTGGFTRPSVYKLFESSAFCRVVAWNGMRGRDRGMKGIVDKIGSKVCVDVWRGRRRKKMQIGKHRGLHVYLAWLQGITEGDVLLDDFSDTALRHRAMSLRGWDYVMCRLADTGDHSEHYDKIGLATRPSIMSYRSVDMNKNVWFDSVVWSVPWAKELKRLPQSKTRQRVAAAKAVASKKRLTNLTKAIT